ncbi:MAG: phosphatase PAP2 family protein [Nevskia sp.]|nr:phosphatase PAP2 family protein [Nevskia sp.]
MNLPPPRETSEVWTRLMLMRTAMIVCTATLIVLPELDMGLSGLFYRPDQGFYLDHSLPVQIAYKGVPLLLCAVVPALIGGLAWFSRSRDARARRYRSYFAFALLSLALGPGLVGNTLLKEHWGRPRPEQITQFGGTGDYVPAYLPSRQCTHNCSFVSGHAAVGYWLMSGAWLWPRRRWRWRAAGLLAGSLVGLARIAQGGHFFSDVAGALLVVWLTDEALYHFMVWRGWLAPTRPTASAGRGPRR